MHDDDFLVLSEEDSGYLSEILWEGLAMLGGLMLRWTLILGLPLLTA